MGTCCERPVNKAEEFIQNIYGSMEICQKEYQTIKSLLIENSSWKSEEIFSLDLSLNQYLDLAKLNFFKSEIGKQYYSGFNNFFFKSTYEVNNKYTYAMIFSLLSLIKNEKLKYLHFYDILRKINYSKISYDSFCCYLEQYLNTNLIAYTGYILNYNFDNEYEENKTNIQVLIDTVYNPQNIKNYTQKLLEEFSREKLVDKDRYSYFITEEDFKLIFDEKRFFFDFNTLRHNFLSIYGGN